MVIVFFTALMVGGATCLGAVGGFALKHISHRFSDIVLGFAAGVMLSAAVLGLILPAVELGGLFISILGIFFGAIMLNLIDRAVPHVHRMFGNPSFRDERLDKVMLFVTAIAIHNFPEGLASGVAFGTGNTAEAILIAGGIALQNLPEGMVTVTPMLAAGIPPKRALRYGIGTGIIEIVGTLIGYFAVTAVSALLPFALAFAGGTMLCVIIDEMLPETHGHGNEKAAVYSFLIGFCLMMVSDILLG